MIVLLACLVSLQRSSSTADKKKDAESAIKTREFVGKCCVLRFPNLDLAHQHFVSNIEPDKLNDRFTLRKIQIVADVPGASDWHSFKPGTLGKSWLLRGSVNSEDEKFGEYSRAKQGLAIAVTALIAAKIVAPSKWSREDVDTAIVEGDDFFNWCLPEKTDGQEVSREKVSFSGETM